MRVEEIMARQVATCRPEQTAADAARLMWERDCGCIPIVDADEELVGIVTDRDLCMAAVTRGLPLDQLRLDSVMQSTVQTCRRTDSVREAERRMSEAQVRRIPIVEGLSRVVGIVSIADLARARGGTWLARMGERILGDLTRTMAAITEPRPSATPEGS